MENEGHISINMYEGQLKSKGNVSLFMPCAKSMLAALKRMASINNINLLLSDYVVAVLSFGAV
jgi:uncharacterized protein (UPF0371 family)